MFGIYRLYLALMVLVHHYYEVRSVGYWAVVSFFILSGFLMTAIMQGSYGYSPAGMKKYALNRILRLFPSYYFVALVTGILLIVFPAIADDTTFLPTSYQGVLANLTMIFPSVYPIDFAPRLVHPTWALTLEIFFYILIALGVSRTRLSSLIWLGVGILYIFYKGSTGRWLDSVGYGTILEATLPFSVGAVIYHYREELRQKMVQYRLADWRLVGTLFVINQLAAALGHLVLGGDVWKINYIGSYINIGLSAVMILCLFYTKSSGIWKKRDTLLGQFSYPVYLTHTIGASMALYGANLWGWHETGAGFTLIALVITFGLGAICVFLIDEPVEKIRLKIKKQQANTGKSPQ